MEGMDMDGFEPFPESHGENDDLCSSILAQFGASDRDDHQHLCAVTGAIAQELRDRNIPLSPVALFGATVSSLERLSSQPPSSSPESPDRAVDALLKLLSIIIPRVSDAVLGSRGQLVAELVTRIAQSKVLSPVAKASGLKCLAKFLSLRKNSESAAVSQIYACLLSYAVDAHPKVRRQSHICVREVLQSFQGAPLLAYASEEIKRMLEKFLLLSGGSQTTSEGPRGAQEILYILDMLKDCLSYMALKYKSAILKYYKSLLELHQPLVTRRVTDSLYVLCLHPTSEIPSEPLLDLLCSLAVSVSANELSADGITFTARLLDSGMRKIFASNREICIIKLPTVFSALRDIFAFEYAEPLVAASETIKSLIEACVDDDLIEQGVGQRLNHTDLDSRKSKPAIIEKICASVSGLLGYQYNAAWDLAFQVLSAMFDKLGESSFELLSETLKGLADLQKLSDDDFPYREQLHECIGSALGAMGPEKFLSIVPLNLESEDLSKANVWIFPILKRYTVGADLKFFMESLLGFVSRVKLRSEQLRRAGRNFSSQVADGLVYSLWSLLPSFCNYPRDMSESFADLKMPVCSALANEPSVRGIICSALRILVQQNKRILNNEMVLGDVNTATRRAMARYSPAVASNNLVVLKSSARHILSVLSNAFLESANDCGGFLLATIAEFASISEGEAVSRLFVRSMNKVDKLLKSEEGEDHVRAQQLDLAMSLLPGLRGEEINVLFLAIIPAVKGAEGLNQKKGYKVLLSMLKSCDGFIAKKLGEVTIIMEEAKSVCHSSAKRHRLDCLHLLIIHVFKNLPEQSRWEFLNVFLAEIILALKEANKKTRNRAYDILVQVGHACGDEEQGGTSECLHKLFHKVAAAMTGGTHMISATVKGLARLAYEFSDLISSTYGHLPSVFLLCQRKNREITKANLGLIKVLVAKSHAESLQTHLKSLVEGLLNWGDDTKNHSKAKVKHLMEMLVKRCGLEAVKAVMPEEHMKLLTNIRKTKERRERKLKAKSEEGSLVSGATTSRHSKWNHTRIFSDLYDESDAGYMERDVTSARQSMLSSKLKSRAMSLKSKNYANSLKDDLVDQMEDEPLDLLDQQRTRSVLRSGGGALKRKLESEELELDPDGRLIIREEDDSKTTSTREMANKTDDDDDYWDNSKSEGGPSRYLSGTLSTGKAQKKRKTSESGGWAYTGDEYASKKARGDLKRKGKLEPYAYWPLDRKLLSRRRDHRVSAARGMQSVVKLTKKLEGKSASSALSKLKKAPKKGSKRKAK